MNARDKFRISTFYLIIDILKTEMTMRGQVHNDIADKFSCLFDVPEKVTSSSTEASIRHSECCQKLIDAYPIT